MYFIYSQYYINYIPAAAAAVNLQVRTMSTTMKPTVFLTRTDMAPIGIELLKSE